MASADGAPVVAGVVIETLAGQTAAVAAALADVEGLQIVGDDGERRLAGVWTAAGNRELEEAVDRVLKENEGVIGIFPTFIGSEEDLAKEAGTAGHDDPPSAGDPRGDS